MSTYRTTMVHDQTPIARGHHVLSLLIVQQINRRALFRPNVNQKTRTCYKRSNERIKTKLNGPHILPFNKWLEWFCAHGLLINNALTQLTTQLTPDPKPDRLTKDIYQR